MTSKLAVFDLDGTLLDSRAAIGEAMARAFAALGLPSPPYEETRKIVGLSLAPALARLAPELPPARYGALAQAYRDAFVSMRKEKPYAEAESLYPGAAGLVRGLKEAGWILGVATGKARRGVDAFFDGHALRDYFDCAFCADDGPGKPDPHMLRCNMEAAGIAARDTMMIGDTSFDMAMARAAGAYAQGVSWGFHTVREIEEAGAHHIADDFAALTRQLSAFAASDV